MTITLQTGKRIKLVQSIIIDTKGIGFDKHGNMYEKWGTGWREIKDPKSLTLADIAGVACR